MGYCSPLTQPLVAKDVGTNGDNPDFVKKEEIMLHIFVRAANFYAQAGLMETAITLFQAMIELSCFCPADYAAMDFDDRIENLETFWETDQPRFGEEGAVGWAANVKFKPGQARDDSEKETPAPVNISPNDDYVEIWFKRETAEEFHHWLPMRHAPDYDLDDDFRHILFEDVRPLLFDATLPSTRRGLLHAFLNLLGVPSNSGTPSTHPARTDPLLNAETLGPVCSAAFWPPRAAPTLAIAPADAQPAPTVASSPAETPFPIRGFPMTAESLFAHGGGVPGEENTSGTYLIPHHPESSRNILQQSRTMPSPDPDLLPLFLVFESAFSPKSAQKAAKNLLKTERMNLLIWNAYAQIEVGRGNIDEARKVYQASLLSYHTFPRAHQKDAPLLFRQYAELEVDCNQPARAIVVLVACAEEKADFGE
ncbi:NRDE-2, necessary for RNA interference-domain-containing protein [Blyttiomyces helicus]|uniref:NRDE-2, necessary for RNA interference-domain-containing protein n=1 Tax=Blyttiomyces helicus TaxID=388810 RepID=A0A4P9WNV9_9FUNG|nr:NRDE-2, necessary for RNA interference-domain-containing protein [Blyttiomyces helicus]|eukprot:RKO92456.1 NRDE-2, necessary for RNA interference-domain-containing protein [Blyttiomyces helicus]